jgi:hypothetical protein
MVRRIVFSAMVVLIWLSCSVQASVVDSNWVGGHWGFWENRHNWDPPIVPDNNETKNFRVAIDGGEMGAEILIQENHEVNRIDTCGEVELARHNWQYKPGIILLEPNGLTNRGFLEIEDELKVVGNILNASSARLNGWFDVEDGNLLNQAGARVDATDGYIDVHDGSIYNYGSIVCGLSSGPWAAERLHNFGEVEVYSGICSSDQTLTNENTGSVKGSGLVHSDELINNAGLIQSLGGALTLHSRVDFEGPYFPNRGLMNTGKLTNSPGTSLTVLVWLADVNNQGTIEVNADGSVVFDCDFRNEPNGAIRLLGGTLGAATIMQSAHASFSGFGTITGDIAIDVNGIIQLTGPTNIVGDVNVAPGAILEISDGQTLITGHTTCDGTIRLIGGTVVFQGGCDCDGCDITHDAGAERNHFDVNGDGIVNFLDYAYFADQWLWRASWY